MKAHELARQLLDSPNEDVVIYTELDTFVDVRNVENGEIKSQRRPIVVLSDMLLRVKIPTVKARIKATTGSVDGAEFMDAFSRFFAGGNK